MDMRYAVPFVMPLVGAALGLLVHSLDVARSHFSSLSRKMNHLEALHVWQALNISRCALAGKTDLTALVQQVHVRELLKLQGDWHRPV